MPYAALSRQAWALFCKGELKRAGQVELRLRFTAAWTLGPAVQQLFPVPSCVPFAELDDPLAVHSLPAQVQAFSGTLPRRNAGTQEADAHLSATTAPWAAEASYQPESPYRRSFRQGANLVPRRLVLVKPAPISGMLPPNPDFPLVRGRTGTQDEEPWKNLEPPQGTVERNFLHSSGPAWSIYCPVLSSDVVSSSYYPMTLKSRQKKAAPLCSSKEYCWTPKRQRVGVAPDFRNGMRKQRRFGNKASQAS